MNGRVIVGQVKRGFEQKLVAAPRADGTCPCILKCPGALIIVQVNQVIAVAIFPGGRIERII